jgi:hypothetical protein
MGQARVVEIALVHPAVACCVVCLRPGRFPSIKSIHGPKMEAKNSRTFRVAPWLSGEDFRSARLDRVEYHDSVLARVGAVESCWLSDLQDVKANSAAGLLEEIEPQAEVFTHGAWDLVNHF